MAVAGRLPIACRGSVHGSARLRVCYPIPVACETVLAHQTMATRQFDMFDPGVPTVERIACGTWENVIDDRSQVRGHGKHVPAPCTRSHGTHHLRLMHGIAPVCGLEVRAEYGRGVASTLPVRRRTRRYGR